MFEIGKVSSVNEKKRTVKVLFESLQNSVSGDFFVLKFLGASEGQLPEVNERVVCIRDNNGVGFVIGSYDIPSD